MKNAFRVEKSLSRFLFIWLILLMLSIAACAQKTSATTMEIGDDGVPVLIKHLPDWETAQKRAAIVANLSELQKLSGNRPILNELEFAGGTEAVTAVYDKVRLVIVEFQTPQMAFDADNKVKIKLAESPPPAATYRKVGNYLVFVFDASDEKTADNLISAVSYEKNVVWFGDSPYAGVVAARKERDSLVTTGDIILTVVKTSGLAVLAALGVGGLFGALLFYSRRRQQTNVDAYSDAGGMLRLNLDEMTPRTDTNRLLEK